MILGLASCSTNPKREKFTVAAPFGSVNQQVHQTIRSMERRAGFFQDGIMTRRADKSPTLSKYAVWFWAGDTGSQFCTRYVDVQAAGQKTEIEVKEDRWGRKESVIDTISAAFPSAKREVLEPIDLLKGNWALAIYGKGEPSL
jgi:hypothetical protein